MRVALFICTASVVWLTACAPGVPNPATAEAALKGAITGTEAQRVRLTAFNKTDGQSREVMGVKAYALEFKATIDVLEDVLYQTSGHQISVTAPGPTLGQNSSTFSWDGFFNTAVAGRQPANKGDHLTVTGTVTYERKESGWVVAALDIKATHVPLPLDEVWATAAKATSLSTADAQKRGGLIGEWMAGPGVQGPRRVAFGADGSIVQTYLSSETGQYTNRHTGKWVVHNGRVLTQDDSMFTTALEVAVVSADRIDIAWNGRRYAYARDK
jgi:hypothetical protein